MRIREVADALESFAPLPLQESFDNAGLQVGLTGSECSGALLCLDVTEDIVREAARKGCNLVVSHHPLLFHGLKCVSDTDHVQRCVREAVKLDVAIYSAHTNLDNARGGVNFEIARRIGLCNVGFLSPLSSANGGSGIVGELPRPEEPLAFLRRVKQAFGIDCLQHNEGPQRPVRKVALCGGAGDFLLPQAVAAGADVFLTGEMHYHCYFGWENTIWTAAMGHYQSEQFTISLLHGILEKACPSLPIYDTEINTNPIKYM